MKLLKKEVSAKDGAGSVKLVPEQAEDMYTLYNLIAVGDSVRTLTLRKIVKEATGKEKQTKTIKMALTIQVEKVDFDTDVCSLRLSGQNLEGTEHVAAGQYHTLVLEPNRAFTLTKPVWDAVYLEALEESTNPERIAEIAAIVMEVGLAHVCLIAGNMTVVKGRIQKSMPKGHAQKRFGKTDKAMEKYFEMIYRTLATKINLDRIKVIILGSPGHLNDDFFKYMMAKAVKEGNDGIQKARKKFCLVTTTSGHKHALEEALADESIRKRVGDTKAIAELKALEKFKTYLANDDARACYGIGQVTRATDLAAVDTLLVTDSLFRSRDLTERKKYVTLVEDVRQRGGEARVLSSMHPSGEDLNKLCAGVCAILRFPLVEDDDEPLAANGEKKRKPDEQDLTYMMPEPTSLLAEEKKSEGATGGEDKGKDVKGRDQKSKPNPNPKTKADKVVGGHQWKVGQHVAAKYSDGCYYPAKIKKVSANSLTINYTEYNEQAVVKFKDVKPGKMKRAPQNDDYVDYGDKYDDYDDFGY